MGNGRIAKHNGNLGNTQSFFIEQVPCVLHTLALVEIKNRGAEEFFKPFLQITLIDGHFAA